MIKGTDIQIVIKTSTENDELGNPIYTETLETVSNVLVGQPSTDDVAETIQLYGKHIAYVLGIPKGDEHNWVDTDVIVFGERFHTIGYPMTGIQDNIPLNWGQNVRIERYGGC